MTLNIGLGVEQREGVVGLLSALLADEYVLYTKTRNYHWNVVGPQFNDLHKFFQDQYEALNDVIDDVAERARTLGGHAVRGFAGTLMGLTATNVGVLVSRDHRGTSGLPNVAPSKTSS